MEITSQIIFHFYRPGHVAVEVTKDFQSDSVFGEISLFSLLVARAALRMKEKGKDIEHIIRKLDSFRLLAVGMSKETISVNEVRKAIYNEWTVAFNGVPGSTQIIVDLKIEPPNMENYQFGIEEKGWFGLFGASKHLGYGSAMNSLWGFLSNKRVTDLRYLQALNTAGFLAGKAVFDGELSLRTEPAILNRIIDETIQSQPMADPDRWVGPELLEHLGGGGLAVNVKQLIDNAHQGDVTAQSFLGILYEQGNAVFQDLSQAERWYRRAAQNGDLQAQFNLASIYLYGRGVEQSYSEAGKWFRQAAEKEMEAAQFMLGFMYAQGYGFPQNYAQAAIWYKMAAEKGNQGAQVQLGWMYAHALGVNQDQALAVHWYRQAAESGDALAQVK